jgi:hypothetical protein
VTLHVETEHRRGAERIKKGLEEERKKAAAGSAN